VGVRAMSTWSGFVVCAGRCRSRCQEVAAERLVSVSRERDDLQVGHCQNVSAICRVLAQDTVNRNNAGTMSLEKVLCCCASGSTRLGCPGASR